MIADDVPKNGSPAQVVMNDIQRPDIRGTERDSSLSLQGYWDGISISQNDKIVAFAEF